MATKKKAKKAVQATVTTSQREIYLTIKSPIVGWLDGKARARGHVVPDPNEPDGLRTRLQQVISDILFERMQAEAS